jgi:hypothetical protein
MVKLPNNLEDSGEWLLQQWGPMYQRLDKFRPIDPKTGEKMSFRRWGEQIGLPPATFADMRSGTHISWKNHVKIIFWLVTHGISADEIVWWQTGFTREQIRAGEHLKKTKDCPAEKGPEHN